MTDNTQDLDEILAKTIHDTGAKLTEIGWERWGENLEEAKQALIDWHNKQIEAYHNELTDNEKKVWIYADDLEKRKAKAVEEVLEILKSEIYQIIGDDEDWANKVKKQVGEPDEIKDKTPGMLSRNGLRAEQRARAEELGF